MRKEADFEVQNHIKIYFDEASEIADIVKNNAEEIKAETLADELGAGMGGYSKEWSINGKKLTLGVERL
jgi:isoleucyl-tRNA synthetase